VTWDIGWRVSAGWPLLCLKQFTLELEFLDLAERGAGHLGEEVPADRHFETGKVLLAQRPQPGRIG
jgi:hypothetical protein